MQSLSHRSSQGSVRLTSSRQQPAPHVLPAGRGRKTQVVFAVGGRSNKGGRNMMQQDNGIFGQNVDWTKQPAPELDPKNVQFVVFVRNLKFVPVAGAAPQASYWVPLGPISGGATANVIVQAMASEWARLLLGNLMVRNIALGIYKDKTRAQTETRMRNTYQVFKGAAQKDMQYGFNIRNVSAKGDWYKPTNMTLLPVEAALDVTAMDATKAFFNVDKIKAMLKLQ